jgi:Na+-translocating ferredoxin:NAD+ oxidoreductase RNF subunit RnfB
MADKGEIKEKARKIVRLLPKSNCGRCGFENCGKFAMAVAAGTALPFGCQEHPLVSYKMSEIIGVKVPEEARTQESRLGFSQPGMPISLPIPLGSISPVASDVGLQSACPS